MTVVGVQVLSCGAALLSAKLPCCLLLENTCLPLLVGIWSQGATSKTGMGGGRMGAEVLS